MQDTVHKHVPVGFGIFLTRRRTCNAVIRKHAAWQGVCCLSWLQLHMQDDHHQVAITSEEHLANTCVSPLRMTVRRLRNARTQYLVICAVKDKRHAHCDYGIVRFWLKKVCRLRLVLTWTVQHTLFCSAFHQIKEQGLMPIVQYNTILQLTVPIVSSPLSAALQVQLCDKHSCRRNTSRLLITLRKPCMSVFVVCAFIFVFAVCTDVPFSYILPMPVFFLAGRG